MEIVGWDISADHAVPSTAGQSIAGFRACLGVITDDRLTRGPNHFLPQLRETLRRAPEIVTLDYTFLAGPRRGLSMEEQIEFYSRVRRCEIPCLDWERDVYKHGGVTYDMGSQPLSEVARGVRMAVARGMRNIGVYASVSVFSPHVVDALRKAGVAWLWVAGYGVAVPAWLLGLARQWKMPLLHQYTGTGVDRNRLLVGTLEDLHRLAGRPPVLNPHPEEGDNIVLFIQVSAADRAKLETIRVPADTVIEDFAGHAWTKIGPTTVPVYPGLVDAHSDRRVVVVRTGRFYEDGQERFTAQVAVIPKE